MKNPVQDAILKRCSTRAFTAEALTDEQLRALADAALAAPSSMNRQPWQVIVVTDQALIEEMDGDTLETFRAMGNTGVVDRVSSRGGRVFYNAPCVIHLPVCDKDLLDAGIAVENIALAAEGMGLGSCIIGMIGALFSGPKAQAWKQKLQFPETHDYAIAIAVGHKAAEGTPHAQDPGKVTYIR